MKAERSRGTRLLAGLLTGIAFTLAAASASAQLFGGRSGATKTATIEVLDVGQGDSILIRSPEGKTALVDAGPTKDAALKQLRRKGIQSLDMVAISHHHSDHYGGMDQVIRAMKPRYFLASRSGHTTALYLKLLKTVQAEGITVIEPTSRPRKVELGSVELVILPQPPEDRKEENNNSIGLRVRYGNVSLLLTGDSEETERQWWLKNHADLVSGCTILKLPHHGSRNGTDARWLRTVQPEIAVASLGRNNDYGHPHSETISLLRKTGLPLLRTDLVGTITITTDGRSWQVVEPRLASRGRPSQADIDRVAVAADTEPSTRSSRGRVR
jgi:beta-lactamase superfamily II metal-dependent hydrolase